MAGRHRPVHLELTEAPSEVPVGSDLVVRLRVSCLDGYDRCGLAVHAVSPDGSQTTHPLGRRDGTFNETGDVVLSVPRNVGQHVWRFALPQHEIDGAVCASADLALSIRAAPQTTSLAVWDIPSPVVSGTPFDVRIGAKSAAASELKSCGVEVLRDGKVVARTRLGEEPWPGTAALYWADATITAPAEAGVASWAVRFDAATLELPHEGTSSSFSAVIVPPPQHKLTVKVTDKETARPIDEALVRLGAYRAETGRSGFAEIDLPKGRYELAVWKVGYDIAPATLDFDRDTSIEIEALPVPEEDPDAHWKM